MAGNGVPIALLDDSLLYLTSLLRDQPRPIDRYLDYFGAPSRGVSGRRVVFSVPPASAQSVRRRRADGR